jgi:hypothetical protein
MENPAGGVLIQRRSIRYMKQTEIPMRKREIRSRSYPCENMVPEWKKKGK